MVREQSIEKQPVEYPTFAVVAQLVAPNGAPAWLPAHLEWWAQGLRHDRLVDEYRPTTVQTVKQLSEVASALTVLEKGLENPMIRNLIAAARTHGKISITIAELKDLAYRVESARSSPLLVGRDGKTKRGRAKPQVPDVFDAKTLCAARIVEAWRFFNGKDPGISNLKAAQAAQGYWLASGGTTNGYGNPLNGWYDYFKIVRDCQHAPGLKRLIWRRDLQQSARRGRQPWYLGTYFPAPKPEINSAIPG